MSSIDFDEFPFKLNSSKGLSVDLSTTLKSDKFIFKILFFLISKSLSGIIKVIMPTINNIKIIEEIIVPNIFVSNPLKNDFIDI